jgi:hypothetical protein
MLGPNTPLRKRLGSLTHDRRHVKSKHSRLLVWH